MTVPAARARLQRPAGLAARPAAAARPGYHQLLDLAIGAAERAGAAWDASRPGDAATLAAIATAWATIALAAKGGRD